jgi:hypothetical protein
MCQVEEGRALERPWSTAAERVAADPDADQREGDPMKIQIKRVESIKATRAHLDPNAGGA